MPSQENSRRAFLGSLLGGALAATSQKTEWEISAPRVRAMMREFDAAAARRFLSPGDQIQMNVRYEEPGLSLRFISDFDPANPLDRQDAMIYWFLAAPALPFGRMQTRFDPARLPA